MDRSAILQLVAIACVVAWMVWRTWQKRDGHEPHEGASLWVGVDDDSPALNTERGPELEPAAEAVVYTASSVFGTTNSASFALAATCDDRIRAAIRRSPSDLEVVRAQLRRWTTDARMGPLDEIMGRAVLRGGREVTLVALWHILAEEPAPLGPLVRELRLDVTSEHSPPGTFLFVVNDNVSPMEEVVALLRRSLGYDALEATYTMYRVHVCGFAPIGPLSEERKVELEATFAAARTAAFPLRVTSTRPDTSAWQNGDHGLLP